MFICAGESEQFDFALPIGIGMVDVSINLTRLCISQKPQFLFFVGTAGSYGEKKIFNIVESKSASNIENSFFTGDSYTPIDNLVSSAEDSINDIVVNSSNYITTSTKLSKSYLAKNIQIENMEFYAVLKVAKSFGIPVAGAFIVTNYCDNNAHRDFLSNHKEAMVRLTEYVRNV
ncbi:MAG: purine-nucleoside phosphorylase [Sulfurovum sp.]